MTTGDGEGPQSPASIAPSLQASQQEGLVGENPATCPPLASLLANTQRIESGPPGLPGGVLSLFSKVGSTGGQGGGVGQSCRAQPQDRTCGTVVVVPPWLGSGERGECRVGHARSPWGTTLAQTEAASHTSQCHWLTLLCGQSSKGPMSLLPSLHANG